MSTKEAGPFHVVRHAHNDVTTGYSVYVNNKPYSDQLYSRKHARWLVDDLNAREKLNPTVPVLSRDELLAVS